MRYSPAARRSGASLGPRSARLIRFAAWADDRAARHAGVPSAAPRWRLLPAHRPVPELPPTPPPLRWIAASATPSTPWTVLYRLGDVRRPDLTNSRQVSDDPNQLEHPEGQ